MMLLSYREVTYIASLGTHCSEDQFFIVLRCTKIPMHLILTKVLHDDQTQFTLTKFHLQLCAVTARFFFAKSNYSLFAGVRRCIANLSELLCISSNLTNILVTSNTNELPGRWHFLDDVASPMISHTFPRFKTRLNGLISKTVNKLNTHFVIDPQSLRQVLSTCPDNK